MDPRSQVLLRLSERPAGPVLLAGVGADGWISEWSDAHAWTWMADDAQALEKLAPNRCHFGVKPPEGEFQSAVLFLPKSRDLTDYLLTCLAALLPDKTLYLVGEKRAGIERAAKQLQPFGTPRKLDSARHCQLWCIQVTQAPAMPDLDQLAKTYTVELPDGPLTLVSVPGTFSHGRLDMGTELFLPHLTGLPTGAVLDFGCGVGVIGAYLKRNYPQSTVYMLDVDAFALHSSALTLQANQLEAVLIAGRGIEDAPQNLAAIISNPPFHQGVHTHYAVTENLLTQAHRFLQKKGELRIVANSFLRYPPLIERNLSSCETLSEGRGFHIYRATQRA